MHTKRKPERVAKRALILGAVAFRASLEETSHPRVVEITHRLLPWLCDLGCDDEIDPIERELLETPRGQLSDSQRIDANSAGEAATFFCWALNLVGPLNEANPADQSVLPELLSILKPEAAAIIQSASLQDSAEIKDMCLQVVMIRSILQEMRVGLPGSNIIRRLNVLRLNEVGIVVTEDTAKRASDIVAGMTPQERDQAAGLYFVRDHAALWLFSDRSRYFD